MTVCIFDKVCEGYYKYYKATPHHSRNSFHSNGTNYVFFKSYLHVYKTKVLATVKVELVRQMPITDTKHLAFIVWVLGREPVLLCYGSLISFYPKLSQEVYINTSEPPLTAFEERSSEVGLGSLQCGTHFDFELNSYVDNPWWTAFILVSGSLVN